jgi:hypothetical protein
VKIPHEDAERLARAKRVAPELRALTDHQWTSFYVIETAYRHDLLDRYESMVRATVHALQVSEELVRYIIQPPR